MHLSNTNQVESGISPPALSKERGGLMQWNAIEVYAIADTDSVLAKDTLRIAEGD